MTSVSGYWAGTYAYPNQIASPVNFDCDLRETAGAVSGEITESHGPGQMLVAGITGQLSGSNISFTKRYKTTEPGFLWEIAYAGQVSPKKDHIAGTWRVGGRQGTFEMHRDAGELQEAKAREMALD